MDAIYAEIGMFLITGIIVLTPPVGTYLLVKWLVKWLS